MTTDTQQRYLVTRIGTSDRLLELAHVREIVPAMQLTRPEGVSGVCRGIANVRGNVLPVFDLEARAGALEPMQMIIIARTEQGMTIGILVDEVLELVLFAAGEVVNHPAGHGRRLCTANLRGNTLSVLTPEEVLDAA